MSEEKDHLKSIKVYKFNNTKENWQEFALKFRVIADTGGYWEIINGTLVPPDEQMTITVTSEDKGETLKEKKEKLEARAANKMGYRDLDMSTEAISLNIVENAVSKELTKGDLMTEFRQPLQVQIHLEMPRILVQLGHTQPS